MLKRIFALLLSAVLLLGLLAGCSKNQPDGTNEQSPCSAACRRYGGKCIHVGHKIRLCTHIH